MSTLRGLLRRSRIRVELIGIRSFQVKRASWIGERVMIGPAGRQRFYDSATIMSRRLVGFDFKGRYPPFRTLDSRGTCPEPLQVGVNLTRPVTPTVQSFDQL